jgi:hypothetical protein
VFVRGKLSSVCLAVGLSIAAGLAGAQQPATDPEVVKGVKQVEDGEYDAAILTLDNAARRLAADPTKSKDLSQAYLYLGVAYVGKGHEAAAKAKFREAVKQLKDLSLSPDKFPPRVIDLFESAREEAAKTAGATPAPARAEGGKGGGSKTPLIIGGAAVVAGGGAYLAFGRKDEETGCDTVYFEREGILNNSQLRFEPSIEPASEAGPWKAEVNWTVTGAPPGAAALSSSRTLPTDVKLAAFEAQGGRLVADGFLVNPTMRVAEWPGAPGVVYIVKVSIEGGGSASFKLVVAGPCK